LHLSMTLADLRSRAARALRSVLLITLSAAAFTLAAVAPAHAEACPGSGAGPCPYTSVLGIGQRAEGVLRFPEAVALDPQGDVFVADQLSYVVQKFSAAGAFETEWGSYGGGRGQFGPIGGLATDAAGDVYVVDSSHNRIEKFDANGSFITSWGHSGSAIGQFRFFSSQNPSQPPGGGIAVAGSYVYVADSGNNRIERFNLEGGEAIAWGVKGEGPGQFSYPRGVAANASEVLVADDDNHRIEKFDPNGVFQAAMGSQGTGPGQFGFPYGVALDAAGNVYVADDANHRIVKLNSELAFLRSWGGPGSGPGQLAFPRALAADPAGDTYVADTANGRIEVFEPEGGFLRAFGASGRSLGTVTGPRGLATDPAGGLLVSDTVANRLELFAPGGGAFAAVWNSVAAPRAGFHAPAGIAVDPRGPVYIADPGAQRVLRVWGDDTFLSELVGPGGAPLSGAGAVAVAPASGTVYVADSGHNRVLVYSPEGALLASWGAGGGSGAAGAGPGEFNDPVGVAVAASGEVYVADRGNNRIVQLHADGSTVRSWGSRGSSDGRFLSPAGVALDGGGDVYVLDGENNRVQVFDPTGRFLEKWGLRGTALGEFSQPAAIATDCAGSVYVADTNNNRVQRFDGVSRSPAGCIPAGDWPPPLDVAPVLTVSLTRHTGVLARRALALTVTCQRGCRILTTATLAPRGPRSAVALIPASRSLPPALAGHVRLRVSGVALHRLRRALGSRKRLTARVTVTAVGPTGRRTILTRTYAVTR
jgi:DNA-binding beta-propeller fold protein YncE